jgi:hypothetical protein
LVVELGRYGIETVKGKDGAKPVPDDGEGEGGEEGSEGGEVMMPTTSPIPMEEAASGSDERCTEPRSLAVAPSGEEETMCTGCATVAIVCAKGGL